MKERLIKAAKETFYFVSSKIFIKNAAMALLLIICVILLTFQGLNCYTNHGESVTVPNFKGQTLTQIKSQLRRSNLRYEVVDSSYDSEKLPLTIMEQTPLPTDETGLKVKENRTIYLTVNSAVPPLRTLPDIWNKPAAYAIKTLKAAGFQVKELERRPDKAENTILEVQYKGEILDRNKEHRIKANSVIGVVIADGGGSTVSIPRVICMTYGEAEMNIIGANLNMLVIDKDGTVTDETQAYIWKQSPMPNDGYTLSVGEEVSVWLSGSLPAGCRTEPTIDVPPIDGGFDEDSDEFEYGGK
jgi:beta-lactam-binding protein with PASTA domain